MVPIKNFILEYLLAQPRLYTLDYVLSHKRTFFFSAFGAFPAINNQGEIAFTAVHNGTPGVFRFGEGTEQYVTIASTKDALNLFGADVSMNAAGMAD
jgi:hypothetical protein